MSLLTRRVILDKSFEEIDYAQLCHHKYCDYLLIQPAILTSDGSDSVFHLIIICWQFWNTKSRVTHVYFRF